jgi:hypothetical protein
VAAQLTISLEAFADLRPDDAELQQALRGGDERILA